MSPNDRDFREGGVSQAKVACALLTLLGCSANRAVPDASRFAVEFLVSKDDGDALEGAVVRAGNGDLGATGADGALRAELTGTEGQTVPVTVTCPDGFAGAERPSSVRLAHTRRVDLGGYQATRFEATCTREVREIVLVVRSEGAGGVPLVVDGRPAGSTNSDGIAHVLAHAERRVGALRVTLDTSSRPELKPKSPTRTYELSGKDAILLFDQTFVTAPKRVLRAAAPKPQKHVPYRID